MTEKLDFPNAELPQLTPLEHSFTVNDVERELKELTIQIFGEKLALDVFNTNVAGNAHLGTIDLVRRWIFSDGLSILPGEVSENAMRYMYRAWKAQNNQGRGLHFIRTYLQILFPNLCMVEQIWHKKDVEYPEGSVTPMDIEVTGLDYKDLYLTSRMEISVDIDQANRTSVTQLINTIRSIIAARFVPYFRFNVFISLTESIQAITWRNFKKQIDFSFDWPTLVITYNPERKWKLGKEGATITPKIVQKTIESTRVWKKAGVIPWHRSHYLSEPNLKLDGSWQLLKTPTLMAECEIIREKNGVQTIV